VVVFYPVAKSDVIADLADYPVRDGGRYALAYTTEPNLHVEVFRWAQWRAMVGLNGWVRLEPRT
jgi:hypothetical protein